MHALARSEELALELGIRLRRLLQLLLVVAAAALQRGKPVVALASTKEDADAMHAALSKQTDRSVAPPRENPFRGLRPRRAAAPAAGYVYANHWVVAVGA